MNNETLLMQNPDVILRENEPGGPMLFNPDNSEMRILNETGLAIWNLCLQPISRKDLLSGILDEYDYDDRTLVEADLDLFLQEMIQQGFIGILC